MTSNKIRSLRSEDFNKKLTELPKDIRNLADIGFQKWKNDPTSVDFKPLQVADKNVYSARVGLGYRALAQRTLDKDGNTVYFWFWIGSREDYEAKQRNLASFRKKTNTLLDNLTNKNKTLKKYQSHI
jgi:hypothetical protein